MDTDTVLCQVQTERLQGPHPYFEEYQSPQHNSFNEPCPAGICILQACMGPTQGRVG